METEKLQSQLVDLAREHSLTVIEEIGISGPMYRLLDKRDTEYYLALMYGCRPDKLH